MAEVTAADLDFLTSLIPSQPGDLPTYLGRCLDGLIAAARCSKACLFVQLSEERLEFLCGRDENRHGLVQAWSEVSWWTLNQAMAEKRLLASGSGDGLAVPIAHLGENVGALYLSYCVASGDESREKLADLTAAQLGVVLAQEKARQEQIQTARRLREERADNEALRRRVDDLERQNEDLRHFAQFASHDLQEPLRSLKGYSEMLTHHMGTGIDEKSAEFLAQIRDASGRMSRLLRDLLDFTQLGELQWSPQRINTSDIVTQARTELGPIIRAAGGYVERDELPWVYGDPVALRVLFRELLSNAIKFRRENPRIHIGSRPSPQGTIIWVRDNGIGIAKENLEDVFQPFRRLHPLDEYSGNGLGLSMARRAVERHGGRIWIERNLNFGVTVYCLFPNSGSPWPFANGADTGVETLFPNSGGSPTEP